MARKCSSLLCLRSILVSSLCLVQVAAYLMIAPKQLLLPAIRYQPVSTQVPKEHACFQSTKSRHCGGHARFLFTHDLGDSFLKLPPSPPPAPAPQKKQSFIVRNMLKIKAFFTRIWNYILNFIVDDYKRKNNITEPSSTKPSTATHKFSTTRLPTSATVASDIEFRENQKSYAISMEDRLLRERHYIENRLKDIERLRQERALNLLIPTNNVNDTDGLLDADKPVVLPNSNFYKIKNDIAYLANFQDPQNTTEDELDSMQYTSSILTNSTTRSYSTGSEETEEKEAFPLFEETNAIDHILAGNSTDGEFSVLDLLLSATDVDSIQMLPGKWKLSEERTNVEHILEDELEFSGNGTVSSALSGSLGKIWTVSNTASSDSNSTSTVLPSSNDTVLSSGEALNSVVLQFMVERGCSVPVFSQASDGSVIAKVSKPPPPPYDQFPTMCLYQGSIVGNRVMGNVYQVVQMDRPLLSVENATSEVLEHDHELDSYDHIGTFNMTRLL